MSDQSWIDVKERLPEAETQVLGWDGYRYCIAYYSNVIDFFTHEPSMEWFIQDDNDGFMPITHWMPIPPTP